MEIALTIIGALIAGFVQAVTGFGGAIMLMQIFPLFLPLKMSAALSGLLCIPTCLQLVLKYRKSVQWKMTALPLVFYMISNTICITIAARVDLDAFKAVFGVLLIALAAYFGIFSAKLKIKPTIPAEIICSSASGVTGGLFGIGGPTMALYFLATTDDKTSYLGTVSFVFLCSEVFSAIMRTAQRIITADFIPYAAVGIVFIIIGSFVGNLVVSKINAAVMKRCVYALLAVSGLITLIKAL